MPITVKSGDTMWGISKRLGVSLDELVKANPQVKNPNLIYPGQQLNVPGSRDEFAAAPASPPPVSLAPPAPPPPPSANSVTVQSGDTLSAIAQEKGVSLGALIASNPHIANPNLIFPGQVLAIPGAPPPAAPVSPAVQSSPTVGGPPAIGVTSDQLRQIMPALSPERANEVLPHLNAAMAEAHIDTPARQAAFLSTLAHESAQLTQFVEYADGWAYEGNAQLGNDQPGDGPRFKGRGAIQLTGRWNYTAAGEALGIDLANNPERAADLDVAFRTAAWFWNTHDLNTLADQRDIDGVSRRVNAYSDAGMLAVREYYPTALAVLGA